MTVMKFVQLFILKKKLKESMSPGDYYVNQADLPSCDLLDLTCINCKGKYTKLMEKLKIIQTFRPPPNVSIAINKSGLPWTIWWKEIIYFDKWFFSHREQIGLKVKQIIFMKLPKRWKAWVADPQIVLIIKQEQSSWQTFLISSIHQRAAALQIY